MVKIFLPHHYQFRMIAAVITTRFLALFVAPGLGKTAAVLRAFITLRKQGKTKAMLVICPMRVAPSTWPKEVRKWSFCNHLTIRVLHGPDKLTELNKPADIYVVNVEGVKWLLWVALKGKRNWPFDFLIVDESGKFKNPSSVILKKYLKPRLTKFRRRVILNGTPAPRGYMDLWGQYLIVDRGVTFSDKITHYRDKYFTSSGYGGYTYELRKPKKSAKKIQKKAAPMTLVIEQEGNLEMPPLVFPARPIILPPKARKHYDEVEDELFTEFEESEVELEVVNNAVASIMCRQLASGAYYEPLTMEQRESPPPSHKRVWHELHTEKIDSLMALIEELQGQPLLIGYDFHHSLVRIKKAIKKKFGWDVPHIGSGVSLKRGLKLEAQWNTGELPILLGHPESIAYGLNFQECGTDMCMFDQLWSLQTFIQFYQRIWRQGVKGSVRVHRIFAENTVEELMLTRIEERTQTQDELKRALIRYAKRRNKKLDI